MSSRVCAVIFSQEHPATLHVLLRSIQQYVKGLHTVVVLYRGTHSEYEEVKKDILLLKPSWTLTFREEQSFCADTYRLLGEAFWTHYLFLSDETVFIKHCQLLEGIKGLQHQTQCLSFSYRLGLNTTRCWVQQNNQQKASNLKQQTPFCYWRWTTSSGDYGYPFDMTASLYRASDIRTLIYELPLKPRNPKHFQDIGTQYMRTHVKQKIFMAAYEQSCAYVIPLQDTLHNLYLWRQHQEIMLEAIPQNTNAAHKKVEYKWKDRKNTNNTESNTEEKLVKTTG